MWTEGGVIRMGGYVITEALGDELRRFRQLESLFDTIRMMLELDKEQWNPPGKSSYIRDEDVPREIEVLLVELREKRRQQDVSRGT